MKKIAPYILTLAVLTSCGGEEEKNIKKGPDGPMAVDYIIAKHESIEQNISIPGTVVPFENVEVFSEISGRIKKIAFKEGSTVQKGAVLLQIDTDILQAQRKQMKVELDLAEKDEARKKSLLASKAISTEVYEQSFSKMEGLKAQIELIDVQISKGTIRAPFTGKIGLRYVSKGAYITPTSKITSIAQNEKVKIEFAVAEQFAPKIKAGQTILVQAANDTNQIEAVVYATEPTVNESTRMLTVRAEVKGTDNLFPGSFVTVNYNLGANDQSIMLPSTALVPVLKGQKVWKMENGTAKGISVATGVRTATDVQIIGDIQPGDTLITSGLLGLREGAAITGKKN